VAANNGGGNGNNQHRRKQISIEKWRKRISKACRKEIEEMASWRRENIMAAMAVAEIMKLAACRRNGAAKI
jgi:uncharacterized protein (DUF305 family)